MRWLWLGVVCLVAWAVAAFFIGRSLWSKSAFDPNYFAGIASAGLGGALSLIVVMISVNIARQTREKDLNQVRFAFLRKQGEELWQAYVAFCQSIGVDCGPMDQATWNSTDRKLWPDGPKATGLHQRLQAKVTSMTNPPGEKAIYLMQAYDDVFEGITGTVAFEGEHSLSIDLTNGAMQFGWACGRVQDYQRWIGWTSDKWPEISQAIQQTSSTASSAIATLGRLAAHVRLDD